MKNRFITAAVVITALATLALATTGCSATGESIKPEKKEVEDTVEMKATINKENLHEIYLAGGCFWGVEGFVKRLPGVYETDVGYANGTTATPTYKEVCTGTTGHAETVRVTYDNSIISTEKLLEAFFKVVDPTSKNQQGNDKGSQYRSGIYYISDVDLPEIHAAIATEQANYDSKIVTEVEMLKNYYSAEEYHQNYLDNNPTGYCHIDLSIADEFAKQDEFKKDNLKDEIQALIEKQSYTAPTKEQLKKQLTDIQFRVTQNNETERPHTNEYNDNFEKGIYVDITTGEPLFSSDDKFDSSCGWPSFSKPIVEEVIAENKDGTHGMSRTEVRSKNGDSHLGHVFTDGPKEAGGLRYCINSASIKFIPYDKLEEQGYGYMKKALD